MRKLFRSKRKRVIFGVCGGLSEYLKIDVTLIRIVCILITFTAGAGVLLYLVATLIMPEEKDYTPDDSQWGAASGGNSDFKAGNNTGTEPGADYDGGYYTDAENWDNQPPKYKSEKNKLILGAILVGLGILLLGRQFIPSLFNMKIMAPLLLVAIGGFIAYRGRR